MVGDVDKTAVEEIIKNGYLPRVRDLVLRARDRLKGRNDIERVRYGIERLRNKLMGNWFVRFFSPELERIKSIDDIAEALNKIGVAPSKEECREAVPYLEGVSFYDGCRCIVIKKIKEGLYRVGNYVRSRADVPLILNNR